MRNFFKLKDNEKKKNTKKNNSKAEVKEEKEEVHVEEKREEQEGEVNLNLIESSNERNNKNIYSIVEFPERITQINKAHPLLKQKEKIILNQILESLKRGRQKD